MIIDTDDDQSSTPSVFPISFKTKQNSKQVDKKKSPEVEFSQVLKQNEYSMNCLNKIQAQIDGVISKVVKGIEKNSTEMIYEDVTQSPTEDLPATRESLEELIKRNDNLEKNMNCLLNKFPSNNERIQVLGETILRYENQTSTTKPTSGQATEVFEQPNRCVIDLLLDYFCHLDSQIVNKEVDIEHRLLFEMRSSEDLNAKITQPFLLSLFIHQAGWKKLFECVQYLLKKEPDQASINSNLNPTIVLDYLSSLLYTPELWRGTESNTQKQLDEECILHLNIPQIYQLVDFITKELCLFSEIHLQKTNDSKSIEACVENFDHVSVLKHQVNKRVQLLKHFMHNLKLKDRTIICGLARHLDAQRQRSFVTNCFKNTSVLTDNCKGILFGKIQNLLLYNIYLEENSIIEHVSNPNRLFSDLYSQIDIPTGLDVKAHNLLNCFGEIEVNYSQNATSSGTIGVSSIINTHFKKKEKEEVVQFAKKQEAFMMDANLLCIKLASTHPFIFIRQIPMMEGLLQGRVVYSFDEFKRRKFDKLFHYIIDLLTILVPYVFRYEYFSYIESIVAHYFDVFKSYCSENREANGSLVLKFFDFFEKFVNTDIEVIYTRVVRKHSAFISYMYKLYADINSLKFINGTLSIPFDTTKTSPAPESNNNIDITLLSSLSSVNIFNQKASVASWTAKQLEPFISKIGNRHNYDGILLVLNELDTVSQRQPKILSYFVFYLQPLMQDSNDKLRDLSIALIMRYLRLNPKETMYFFEAFIECLTNSNSKIFNSGMKVFSDFIILCSEKSNDLLKYALKGAARHNIEISKSLTDAIRLLSLEKYVY